ncbi:MULTISPECIES: DNA polymerase III subunit delta' [Glaesserella]|uniref:DNA polymerase III subunit delta' n=1 Tax=Glaesserella australis TaxID=2094024 RepID=A0A328C0I0_9PAST|nr:MULTISPECIES: DNA polymerase III subunit delta' [Glaesserella]AUI66831.1 DNA polymerase III subunit delta' [Glaesserella sp. 15-184]RAL19883.1 DNA polymerase III subunit delta' [Glaesserella australis]
MNLYTWHQPTYHQITSTFQQGRGHHALLFKTDVGLGTEQLIRHFTHWLLCQTPQESQPCGQCKSCLLWQSGNHPDFHLLEPIENKDIGIDQVREITAKLQQFSQQGGNAVVYLAGADRLTEAAANALLKTLEEPNSNVYFLLESPLQATMLATIQSRCQTWLIQTPELEQAFDWLQAECSTAQPNEIETALRLCHNRPLICKNFLENDRLPSRKTFLQTFWRFYKSRDVFLLFSAFDKEKDQVLQQLEWLASFFSDALKAKMQISTGWLNPDLQNGIIPFSQQLTAQGLLKGHQIIQQTQRDLVEVNAVNQELMLLDCLSKLALDVFEN